MSVQTELVRMKGVRYLLIRCLLDSLEYYFFISKMYRLRQTMLTFGAFASGWATERDFRSVKSSALTIPGSSLF